MHRIFLLAFLLLVYSACAYAKVNGSDELILKELNQTIQQNNTAKIKEILAQYPNLNLNPPFILGYINKPLFIAARSSVPEVLSLLLQHGADIDGLCGYEDTPLITAIEYQKWDNAKFLIENGADVNKANSFAISPLLELAKGEASSDLFILALEHGGDIYKKNRLTTCTIDEKVNGECPEKYSSSVFEIIQATTKNAKDFLKDIPEKYQQNAKKFLQKQIKIKEYLSEKGYQIN